MKVWRFQLENGELDWRCLRIFEGLTKMISIFSPNMGLLVTNINRIFLNTTPLVFLNNGLKLESKAWRHHAEVDFFFQNKKNTLRVMIIACLCQMSYNLNFPKKIFFNFFSVESYLLAIKFFKKPRLVKSYPIILIIFFRFFLIFHQPIRNNIWYFIYQQ